MNGRVRGLIRPVQRLARLLAGRNQLRRPADRIEGALLLALSAAFLAAIAGAAVLGTHLYQSQRAATAELRPAAREFWMMKITSTISARTPPKRGTSWPHANPGGVLEFKVRAAVKFLIERGRREALRGGGSRSIRPATASPVPAPISEPTTASPG